MIEDLYNSMRLRRKWWIGSVARVFLDWSAREVVMGELVFTPALAHLPRSLSWGRTEDRVNVERDFKDFLWIVDMLVVV
jgi:hypothetical protein